MCVCVQAEVVFSTPQVHPWWSLLLWVVPAEKTWVVCSEVSCSQGRALASPTLCVMLAFRSGISHVIVSEEVSSSCCTSSAMICGQK